MYFDRLRNSSFRIFWIGQPTSRLDDAMFGLRLSWLALYAVANFGLEPLFVLLPVLLGLGSLLAIGPGFERFCRGPRGNACHHCSWRGPNVCGRVCRPGVT